MKKHQITHRTEEKLNALSHGVGAVLGIIGFFLLLRANSQKTPYAFLSIVIYSMSIVLLFISSTLYHLAKEPNRKRRLRILDHISIYYLIAGTYTPVALITLLDGNGWLIFYTVWGTALAGTGLKFFFTGKFEWVSLFLYLLMGWLIVFDLQNLINSLSITGLVLLALGGGFYTLGTFFYAMRRIPYNHLIWHFFVLGGAISHWFMVYFGVV